jgi:5-formyltetrahydrofolate cyclo-ligase
MDVKPALRSRLKAARTRRDQAELNRLAELIAREGVTRTGGAAVVAAYVAVGDEPPTRPLIDRLVGVGCTVLLPIVTPVGLSWGRYDGWDALVPRRGLPEPVDDSTLPIGEADLVFAPALAVDRLGHRLGRGGGYYDRAVVGVARERLVAVVFSDEVLDVVPVEPHDVRVGAALTPDGLVVFPS